jgi:hypothetical protein
VVQITNVLAADPPVVAGKLMASRPQQSRAKATRTSWSSSSAGRATPFLRSLSHAFDLHRERPWAAPAAPQLF